MDKNQKETEKAILAHLKKESKKQQFKVISNCLYKADNDYFTHAVYWSHYEEDQWTLVLRMNTKAYTYDDLFWEIFEMPENINAKESLRANGAFVCPSLNWAEKSYKINSLDSMQKDVEKAIDDFQLEIEQFKRKIKVEYDNFSSFILAQTDFLDEMLLKMIAHIAREDYIVSKELACAELESGEIGGYRNKGKDIYEYIVKYCNEKLKDG